MKALILAAGLGTRLRPWTLYHPKALVPVDGVPAIERLIGKLRREGFIEIVVNVHHFGAQIIDFLNSRDFGVKIHISDERNLLLDTGGGIVHARQILCRDSAPFLVHNADIVSTADLRGLAAAHTRSRADATLLVSERQSGRRLYYDGDSRLRGWGDMRTGKTRPEGFVTEGYADAAFSGIHIVEPSLAADMLEDYGEKSFPIMDYYLRHTSDRNIICHKAVFEHFDIGKPESLAAAESFVRSL